MSYALKVQRRGNRALYDHFDLNDLHARNDADISGDLTVDGDTNLNNLNINSTITVSGDALFTNVTISDSLKVLGNTELNTVTISNTLITNGPTEHNDIVVVNTIGGDETIGGVLPSHSKYAANLGFVLEAVSKSEDYKEYNIQEIVSDNIDLPFDIVYPILGKKQNFIYNITNVLSSSPTVSGIVMNILNGLVASNINQNGVIIFENHTPYLIDFTFNSSEFKLNIKDSSGNYLPINSNFHIDPSGGTLTIQ